MSSDDLLSALGLERRRSTIEMALPVIGFFAAGLVVGTGITMLLTPKSGADIRRSLKGKAQELTHKAGEVLEDVRGALPFAEKSGNGGEHAAGSISGSTTGSSTPGSSVTGASSGAGSSAQRSPTPGTSPTYR